MNKLHRICFLLLLCLAYGCSSSNLDTKPDIVPTIEDEFNVQLWENLSPNGSAFSLLVETIDDHECMNNEINSEVSIQGARLVVNLNGIIQADDCIEGAAPATANVSFATLANGNYDLEINILSLIKNDGFVEVSPSNLKIELNSNDGIRVAVSEIKRVPNNTYWGYIALDKTELTNATSGFLEELEILKDNFTFIVGNYGHFNVSEDNAKVDFDATSIYPDNDKFIFKYSADIIELTKLLDEYRTNETYLGKLEIRVFTYQGLEL